MTESESTYARRLGIVLWTPRQRTVFELAKGTEFGCPLSQFVLADALGLTAIHVNRVLRQLRERDLLTLKKGTVTR